MERFEVRREEIAQNVREAIRAFQGSELKLETIDELINLLHNSLETLEGHAAVLIYADQLASREANDNN